MWRQINQTLTRSLMSKIDALPAPLKAALGFLPGLGAALSYADIHRWTILSVAESYEKQGKLGKEASSALRSYRTALAAEQRAYERLLRRLEKEKWA